MFTAAYSATAETNFKGKLKSFQRLIQIFEENDKLSLYFLGFAWHPRLLSFISFFNCQKQKRQVLRVIIMYKTTPLT